MSEILREIYRATEVEYSADQILALSDNVEWMRSQGITDQVITDAIVNTICAVEGEA